MAKLLLSLLVATAVTFGEARDLLQMAPVMGPTMMAPMMGPMMGPMMAPANTKSVTQTAQGVPDLSTLVAALIRAGLAGTLNDTSLVATVFAPTNAAFVALEKKLGYTPDQLLASSILKPTLLYHVVPKVAAQSPSLANGQVLATLLPGQNLTIYTGNGVTVSGVQTAANVTQANILASKAVIHIVDTVLLPAQSALASAPAPAPMAMSMSG